MTVSLSIRSDVERRVELMLHATTQGNVGRKQRNTELTRLWLLTIGISQARQEEIHRVRGLSFGAVHMYRQPLESRRRHAETGIRLWALALPHGSLQDRARLHHPRKSVSRRWASCHRP